MVTQKPVRTFGLLLVNWPHQDICTHRQPSSIFSPDNTCFTPHGLNHLMPNHALQRPWCTHILAHGWHGGSTITTSVLRFPTHGTQFLKPGSCTTNDNYWSNEWIFPLDFKIQFSTNVTQLLGVPFSKANYESYFLFRSVLKSCPYYLYICYIRMDKTCSP